MATAPVYYFYLWSHRFVLDSTDKIVARTCFGITTNPVQRVLGYEGHVGHTVTMHRMWQGPERLIRELESRIKSDFFEHLVVGTNSARYEWIDETVTLQQIVQWTEWEVANRFGKITEFTHT